VTASPVLSRRSILLGLAAAAGGAAACTSARQLGDSSRPSGSAPAGASSSTSPAGQPGSSTRPGGRAVLLAYYSRAGENYYYGGRRTLDIGNTEVLAGMIRRLTGCDIYRIDAVEPYSDDYDATVARNVREQQADARPRISNRLPALDRYDTVLLASPIWNVRAPMIMTTFTDALDFTGKTVHPVVTYAVSGLGTTERDYAASCRGATLGEGFAVQGEEVAATEPTVRSWLRRNQLAT
jgi:flavodoxin